MSDRGRIDSWIQGDPDKGMTRPTATPEARAAAEALVDQIQTIRLTPGTPGFTRRERAIERVLAFGADCEAAGLEAERDAARADRQLCLDTQARLAEVERARDEAERRADTNAMSLQLVADAALTARLEAEARAAAHRENFYDAVKRAEAAEQRAAALARALGEDAAGVPAPELLREAGNVLHNYGGGPLEERLYLMADAIEAALLAPPPAAAGPAAGGMGMADARLEQRAVALAQALDAIETQYENDALTLPQWREHRLEAIEAALRASREPAS